MATPRQFSTYPSHYSEIFLRARTENIIITEASAIAAKRLRDRLYAFRTAALNDLPASGKLGWIIPLAKMHLDGPRLTIYYPSSASAEQTQAPVSTHVKITDDANASDASHTTQSSPASRVPLKDR